MPLIEAQDERETAHGWSYTVRIDRAVGPDEQGESAVSECEVALSWADHDHWSGGMTPPSRVVEALVGYLLEHEWELPGGRLPKKLDASTARRWLDNLDDELMRRV